MSGRIPAIVLVALCFSPASAAADWFVAPYFGVRFAADTTSIVGFQGTQRDKATFGSSVGFLTDGIFGVEADVGFVPGFFDSGGIGFARSGLVTTVMGNVIIAVPRALTRYGLRPYAIGGLGLLRSRAEGDVPDTSSIKGDVLGLNVGGGAVGPLTDRTSLRFDLRYFHNVGSEEGTEVVDTGTAYRLSFWRATVGLSFRF